MADDKNLNHLIDDKEKDAETGSKIFAEDINNDLKKNLGAEVKYSESDQSPVSLIEDAIPGPSHTDPNLPGPSRGPGTSFGNVCHPSSSSDGSNTPESSLESGTSFGNLCISDPSYTNLNIHDSSHPDPALPNSVQENSNFSGSTHTGISDACFLERLKKSFSEVYGSDSSHVDSSDPGSYQANLNSPGSSYVGACDPINSELLGAKPVKVIPIKQTLILIEENCSLVPSKVLLLQKLKYNEGKESQEKYVREFYSLKLGYKIVLDEEVHHPPSDVLIDEQNDLEGETDHKSELDVAEAFKHENRKTS